MRVDREYLPPDYPKRDGCAFAALAGLMTFTALMLTILAVVSMAVQ